MTLASEQIVKQLSKQYNFRPSRASGQNFLVSDDVLRAIVDAANLHKDDVVLEIGAGFGTLTVELLKLAKKVIAVELDKRLLKALNKLALHHPNLELVAGDIWQNLGEIAKHVVDLQYKLVSNLPYNITSRILRNFLESQPRPREMVLLVQKEVAARVIAKPGKMSLLSVAVQFYGTPSIVVQVPRNNFWPEPDVDSAVLKITDMGEDKKGYQKLLGTLSVNAFFQVVKVGFSSRRKQIHNNLSAGFNKSKPAIEKILIKSGVILTLRPQDLTIEQWIKIAQNVNAKR
ncbi:ribosomal RNA small subunit methyltransferase A [Patescibacteria group bacterium]|nr:ribosomal RNA small subunit methyltransferase A [Patescibacteria group bacterium]